MDDDTSRPRPPAGVVDDDHRFSAWTAEVAGRAPAERTRAGARRGVSSRTPGRVGHDLLMEPARPSTGPATRSSARRARTTRPGSTVDRVWIVDPLDGTREYSEPPRDDWAVHVALWEDGHLVAGAVAQPGAGHDVQHRRTARGAAAHRDPAPDRGQPDPAAGLRRGARRADRRRAGADGLRRRQGDLRRARRDRRLRPRRRAVRVGLAPPRSSWPAPPACTPAALDGAPLVYNQDDVLLPDLLVCRPELADQILRTDRARSPGSRARVEWIAHPWPWLIRGCLCCTEGRPPE